MDSGSDDREDDRMEDEHYQSDSEWTTESDSSNEDGVIEAGEEEEVRERYERENGRLLARSESSHSGSSDASAQEGSHLSALQLARILYRRQHIFNEGLPGEGEMEDIVNPTISTAKAMILRERFKSRAPKAHNRSWIRSHLDSRNSNSKKLRASHCASIIPSFCKTEPVQNRYRVFSGSWTPSGKFFVTASQKEQNQVEIYDANRLTNEESEDDADPKNAIIKKINIEDVGWAIIDLAISSDSKYGAVTSWCNNISVFRIDNDRTDRSVHNIPLPINNHSFYSGHRSAVFSLRYNFNSSKMFGGSNNGRLLLVDIATQKVTSDIDQKNDFDMNAVCFEKFSDNLAFAGGDSGIVSCWDMRLFGNKREKGVVGYFAGHANGIAYIDTAHDGRTVLTSAKDQAIKLWDIRMFTRPEATEKFTSQIADDYWDYRHDYVPTRHQNTVVEVDEEDTSVLTLKGHILLQTLIRAKFSPQYTNNRYIYSGDYRGGFNLWDLHSKELNVQKFTSDYFNCHNKCNLVRDVDWHPHLPVLAASSWNGSVTFWTRKPSNYEALFCETLADYP